MKCKEMTKEEFCKQVDEAWEELKEKRKNELKQAIIISGIILTIGIIWTLLMFHWGYWC